jgi:hypothetical protein
MVAGHFDVAPMGKRVRERLCGLVVPVLHAGQDESRRRDRRQFLRSRVHPRVEGQQQRLGVTAGGPEPVLRCLLVAARLEGAGAVLDEKLPVPRGPLGRVDGLGAFACGLGGSDGKTLLVTAAPDFNPGLRRAATESVLTTKVEVPRIGAQD